MATPLHSRADWGGRPPKEPPSRILSEGLTAHYGGDSPWGTSVDRSTAARFLATADHNRCASILRAWQAYHMDVKGWNDGAYNSAGCPHGHRYEIRGPGRRSGANGTNTGNDRSEAIVYIAGGDDPLTDEAKRAFHDEADRFARRLRWNHSDWKSTSCAGGPIKTWQSQGWPEPEGEDMSAEAERQIQVLYDTFAGPQQEGDTTRVLKVLDNALWTGERIKKAEDEAHAAAILAGNCNTLLDAIVKHLGIDLPEPEPAG